MPCTGLLAGPCIRLASLLIVAMGATHDRHEGLDLFREVTPAEVRARRPGWLVVRPDV